MSNEVQSSRTCIKKHAATSFRRLLQAALPVPSHPASWVSFGSWWVRSERLAPKTKMVRFEFFHKDWGTYGKSGPDLTKIQAIEVEIKVCIKQTDLIEYLSQDGAKDVVRKLLAR